ncbi:ABC transporter substrate-binding protein [Phyllobacterium sp. SB3]|uniref:ABC transporter substrate-binding protein n=1 Tax=Phyllobacterium sp. SB3 TaxID=3156073 RepID=UPI0032AFE666
MNQQSDLTTIDNSRVLSELAPSGTLRVAINLGNPVLVQRDLDTGVLGGVAPEIARNLAARLGVELNFLPFDTPGLITDSANMDTWDVALLAIEPARQEVIDFTSPYLAIEGAYIVRTDSTVVNLAAVDQKNVRIAVGMKTAYELFLSRNIRFAELVHAPDSETAFQYFLDQNLEAAAGIRPALDKLAAEHSELRIVKEPFMTINQAMGVPKGRRAAAAYLRKFVEEIKENGFVASQLEKSGQSSSMAIRQ